MKRLVALTLLLLPLLTSCEDSPTAASGAGILGVESVGTGIFKHLVVTLDHAATIEVTYWATGGARLRVTTNEPEIVDTVFLPRLRANTAYTYEVRVAGSMEGDAVRTGEFVTGTLPPEIADFQFEATGTPTAPLTMIELMVTSTGASGVIVVDQAGEIVWYWKASGGFVNGLTRRANGNFVILDQDRGLIEVDPSGTEHNVLPQLATEAPYGNIHHDVIATPQNTLYFLARETRPVSGTSVTGEAIWEWSPEQDTVRKLWSAFDFLDFNTEQTPASSPSNWLHANSLQIGPRGSLIVSFRNIDQVISISPDFQSLDWRLSGPGGTLDINEADRFFGQHSPVEVAPYRVVIFDNALGGPGGAASSRVIELAIDPSAGRATKVWEFIPDPRNNALRVGSVRRHTNGNTVAAFGWGQGSPIAVYEVTPEGTVQWQLISTSGINRFYRATPLMSIGTETEMN